MGQTFYAKEAGITSFVVTTSVVTGTVCGLTITNNGSGYGGTYGKYPPIIEFIGGGGAGAMAVAILGGRYSGQAGQIVGYRMITGGEGYTSAPTVQLNSNSVYGGTGFAATALITATASNYKQLMLSLQDPGVLLPNTKMVRAVLCQAIYNWYILNQTQLTTNGVVVGNNIGNDFGLNNPNKPAGDGFNGWDFRFGVPGSSQVIGLGSGYGSNPTVTIAAPTDGVQATATATESSGSLASVTITNPGSGYTTPPLVTFSGGGSPTVQATSYAIISDGCVVGIPVSSIGGNKYAISQPLAYGKLASIVAQTLVVAYPFADVI